MPEYMNAALSPRERAELLMKELTIDEKLAQVTGVFSIKGREREMAYFFKNGIGEISSLGFRMCQSVEEASAWQIQLQKLVMDNSRLHIPAIFHMEGVCGPLLIGTTPFPSNINRGASFDPELEEQIGEVIGRQETAFGMTQILAPVLDIARDPRMGRQSESYGEDPTLVSAMGISLTKGIQGAEAGGRKSDSVAKHFLGFHGGAAGIHGAHAEHSERALVEIFGKSFQAAIKEAGLKGIMPCYCSIDGLPVHASKHYLQKLLREEMGFDGMVISDYGGVENSHTVQFVGESKAKVGAKCMTAGVDVELPMPACYTGGLKELIEKGEFDEKILDQAVLRVLEGKFRMGLFEHPFALEGEELTSLLQREEDEALSLRSAQESLILLKNDGILPITNNGGLSDEGNPLTIAVIGPQANNARYQFGGYTHLSMVEAQHAAARSMAGTGEGGDTAATQMKRVPGTNVEDDDSQVFEDVLKLLEPGIHNLLQEMKERLPKAQILYAKGYPKAGADESGFEEALKLIKEADLCILTLGGKNGSGSIATMGEGVDGTKIGLPPAQEAFMAKAALLKKPMIGIHLDGRPISSNVADEKLSAIIEAFSPARYGARALVRLMLGEEGPSGRLPLSVARSEGQIPIYYNHPNGSAWHQGPSIGFKDYVDMPHTPRYPFGFGLSYTTFDYSDLNLSKTEIGPEEALTVSLKVTNTGNWAGTEVVQLYLRDCYASMTRPVKELAGFARVSLAPGESKTVTFHVYPSQTAFLDEDMKWKIEKGEIEVQLGASSEDIRLKGSFRITDDRYISSQERIFAAETDCE